MLLGFQLGVTRVNLDPELSSCRKYCCCFAAVISLIIMSGLILLRVSAAPPGKKPLSTIGSKPLACKHLSGSTKAGTLVLCTPMSLSPSIFPTSCNQIVTTTLPFSEGLNDCSHGFIMSSYVLLAHVHVWVHATLKQPPFPFVLSCIHTYIHTYMHSRTPSSA